MQWLELRRRFSRLDLQVKVVLVLVLVIAPTFLLVSLLVSQLALPVIEEEMRVLGVHAARSIADEVVSERLLAVGKEAELEQKLRETFYMQPSVVQVDAFRRDEKGGIDLAASTEDPSLTVRPPEEILPEHVLSYRKVFEDGVAYWEIWAPVTARKRVVGVVRVEVSLQNATGLERAVRKIMLLAGLANIVLLIVALSYFLRKTIANDRLLRATESQNLELSRQLHEAERQVMMKEKLAVMGQLTASFAHEIGTPLNAMGGHVQLLQDELRRSSSDSSWLHRLGIIGDQLLKIENIVKGFLHSTAKPPSQQQLLDMNQVLEKTLGIVSPRIETLGVKLEKTIDRKLGPVRAVPLDIEQVLLNILNNSLDSIQAKQRGVPASASRLEVFSRMRKDGLSEWIELGVFDSGEGIAKADLQNVFKPFFTTKAVGEGTGLGLTICREIVNKYHGKVEIESKEGSWTRVILQFPYGVNA
ncbi:MAG TPA: ATP-binding protein [Bdellovibrionota bacterium]|jgi:signal transduction histidine kinase